MDTILTKFRYRNVFISVSLEDLTEEIESDIILVPMNAEGYMSGGFAKSVKEKGGNFIENELKEQKPLIVGRSYFTTSGRLKVKKLLHCIIMTHPMNRETTEQVVEKSISHALKQAEQNSFFSVSMPIFGTGFGMWEYDKSASVMISALKSYIDKGTHLHSIKVVGFNKGAGLNEIYKFIPKFEILYDLHSKYALLIIDMLEGFIGNNTLFEPCEVQELIKNINEIIYSARVHDIPIIFIVDSHQSENDYEFIRTNKHALSKYNQDRIINELSRDESDIVVHKKRYSGFFDTNLDKILKSNDVNTLIITGNQTHVCVQNTAIDGFYHNYRILIPEEAVISKYNEFHEQGLSYIERYVGEVIKSSCVKSMFNYQNI